jgi:cytochrome P450
MPTIAQIPLPKVAISSKAFGDDPIPFIEAARLEHQWLASTEVGFLVTSYRAIEDILRLDANLKMPGEEIVDIMGAHGTGWGRFAVDQMLVSSGERHTRLRGSINSAFSPRSVKQLREVMQKTISAILDEWAPQGAFDFAEFASNFPVRVMFALLGVPIDQLQEIKKSLEIHGESFNLEVEKMAIIEAAYQRLWSFVDGVIAERGLGGESGDLLDTMIAANAAGGLSEVELRQLLILIFAAGYDTTKNLLILLMRSLLANPSIYERCAGDFEYVRKVVKEQMRYLTPANTMRTVTEGFTYRDVEIPAGTMLVSPLSISGHDGEVFGRPHVFDPERPEKSPSQGFGRGMHMCIGQFLAIANLEEGLYQIAQRIAGPRSTGEVKWKLFPGVWGITSLPIEFEDARSQVR